MKFETVIKSRDRKHATGEGAGIKMALCFVSAPRLFNRQQPIDKHRVLKQENIAAEF